MHIVNHLLVLLIDAVMCDCHGRVSLLSVLILFCLVFWCQDFSQGLSTGGGCDENGMGEIFVH